MRRERGLARLINRGLATDRESLTYQPGEPAASSPAVKVAKDIVPSSRAAQSAIRTRDDENQVCASSDEQCPIL